MTGSVIQSAGPQRSGVVAVVDFMAVSAVLLGCSQIYLPPFTRRMLLVDKWSKLK